MEFIAQCKVMNVDPEKAFDLLLERRPDAFNIQILMGQGRRFDRTQQWRRRYGL